MGIIKTRKELKKEVKVLYKNNVLNFILISSLPFLIASAVMFFAIILIAMFSQLVGLSSLLPLAMFIEFFAFYVVLSLMFNIQFNYLDCIREEKGINLSLSNLIGSKYFKGVLCISILVTFFTMCWSLLFVIPGYVKSFSYSQAFNIYKDEIDAGNKKVSYLDCITKSRKMMSGHKLDLLTLGLSFSGWIILSFLTFGVLIFFILPYMQATLAAFYQNLADNNESNWVNIKEVGENTPFESI